MVSSQTFRRLILAFAALAVLSVSGAMAAEQRLRVMTYNVLGLPCFENKGVVSFYLSVTGTDRCALVAGWRGKGVRARLDGLASQLKQMARRGTGPDVVLLQEVFTSKSAVFARTGARELAKKSGYRHFAWGPGARDKSGVGGMLDMFVGEVSGRAASGTLSSGLLILSRYPIVATNRIVYGNSCAGQDCGANKGALHVRLKLPGGDTIDVFNTHMQHRRRLSDIRKKQIDMLVRFIRRNARSRWWIAGGDFNFRSARRFPGFRHMLRSSGGRHAGQVCFRSEESCEISRGSEWRKVRGRAPDHQFFRARGNGGIRPVKVTVGDIRVDGKPVSDHQYLEVEYSLR